MERSLDELVTEARGAAATDYDARRTVELVELMNREDATVAGVVGAAAPELAAAIDAIVERLARGGPLASPHELAAAEDDAEAGARELRALGVGPADAVVALSASGRTPYALGALRAAREAGALAVCVVSVPDSELARLADHEIPVVVGPEFVAGSTRLKAGTAQKLVLNTISTVSMIRLGKT